MREIVSPLDGFLSPFGRRGGAADAYAIGGASTELVAAFLTAADGTTAGEYFRTGGVDTDFSMFTFSRSGTATYFDSNGTLQTAADGVARRNAYYYNSGWTKGGLQLEGAAETNKVTHSNDLSTGWTVGSITHTKNATGPLGVNTAIQITASAGTGAHWWYIGTGAATGNQVASCFAKAGTADFLCISSAGPSGDGVWFDLSTGAVGTANGSSAGLIEDLGGGWFLCAAVIPNASFFTGSIATADAQLQTFNAAGTETIFVSGFELKAGSFPTSYIPTTGSTVTRAAETLSIANANVPFDATATTWRIKGLLTYADDGSAYDLMTMNGSTFELYINTGGASTGRGVIAGRTGGTEYAYTSPTYLSPGVNVPFNLAGVAGANLARLAADGVIDAEQDETGFITGAASSDLVIFGPEPSSGFISEIRVLAADSSDSALEAVTS